MTTPFRNALAIALALATTSCAQTDFLHYQNLPPAKLVSVTHNVKEIGGAPKLDIIWQVGGMRELVSPLLQGSDSFLAHLLTKSNVDWKVGVISTEITDPPFAGFTPSTLLNNSSPSLSQSFHQAVDQVISSRDGEEMMNPVMKILRDYPTFSRSGAYLVLIVTNDNHDKSTVQESEFLNYLAALKGGLDHVLIYGVFGSIDLGCDRITIDENWNYAGSTYEKVIQATKGKAFSLCHADFGTSLANISDDLFSRIKSPLIYLASRPLAKSIHVFFHDHELPSGPQPAGGLWHYDPDLNAVVFYDLSFAQGDQEQVKVDYTVDDGYTRP